jgi:hypothetical protein
MIDRRRHPSELCEYCACIGRCPSLTVRPVVGLTTQTERVAKIDRIAAGESVQVEAAGEAEGIFLRKTPDRREIVDAEPCSC